MATRPGDRHFQPTGARFYDARSQREMLYVTEAGHDARGWLCYQHADGQWVTLRRATGRDLLSIEAARRNYVTELPRTPREIVERIREVGGQDMFGVERSRLLEALPWGDAQQFLAADAPHTEQTWELERTKNCGSVTAQIQQYLAFAWGKANDCRGNSAIRSMSHFKGLLWLLGPEHDALYDWIGAPDHYAYYGKPALVRLSDLVQFDWRRVDDGEWRDVEDGDSVTADEALGRGGRVP